MSWLRAATAIFAFSLLAAARVGSTQQLQLLWTVQPRGQDYFCAPASIGYAVYIGGHDGILRALTRDGREIWGLETGFGVHTAPAISANGEVYYGSFNVGLCALHPNGQLKWISKHSVSQNSSPVVGPDGEVYYVCDSVLEDHKHRPHLYCLASDGSERWRLPLPGASQGGKPAIAQDETIYVRTRAGQGSGRALVCVGTSGHVRWQMNDTGSNDPVVTPEGDVYVGTTKNQFIAIAPDGTKNWSTDIPAFASSPAVIDSAGRIYFGTGDGYLHALSPNGESLWVVETAEPQIYMDVPPPGPRPRKEHPGIWWGGEKRWRWSQRVGEAIAVRSAPVVARSSSEPQTSKIWQSCSFVFFPFFG